MVLEVDHMEMEVVEVTVQASVEEQEVQRRRFVGRKKQQKQLEDGWRAPPHT